MLRLGITRSTEQLRDLIAEGKRRGIEVVPLPFTRIEFIDFDLPEGMSPGEDDWLFFTSANGVEAFLKGLESRSIELPLKSKIAAVGKKTQKALEEAGWKVDFIPSEPYGENLFNEFIEKYGTTTAKAVYFRAEEVQTDPAGLFKEAGIEYHPLVSYRTIESQADLAVVTELREDDAILFTAPSAVRVYDSRFEEPLARPIAIGRTTAAEMKRRNWKRVTIMPEPDIEKVLEFV